MILARNERMCLDLVVAVPVTDIKLISALKTNNDQVTMLRHLVEQCLIFESRYGTPHDKPERSSIIG
jgi:predicted phosphoribosyltransferase